MTQKALKVQKATSKVRFTIYEDFVLIHDEVLELTPRNELRILKMLTELKESRTKDYQRFPKEVLELRRIYNYHFMDKSIATKRKRLNRIVLEKKLTWPESVPLIKYQITPIQ
jgi:hypothetical protein